MSTRYRCERCDVKWTAHSDRCWVCGEQGRRDIVSPLPGDAQTVVVGYRATE
jgi:rRNA maturation endonuclease Nob1